MSKSEQKKKRGFKRELIEWGGIFLVIAVLWGTGLHTEVIGRLQQALLWTGILQPELELDEASFQKADLDMPLVSLGGEPANLKQFKGKVIFMNFWATWCAPCIAEMPNIQKMYDDTDPGKVAVVMVSLDEDPETARAFIERKELTLPVYFLTGRRPAMYNSTVIPTTYIISANGYLASVKKGMATYNTGRFKRYLNKLSDK